MLIEISREINTEVFAVLQYDSLGAWGYVDIYKGEIIEDYYSEEDDDYQNMIIEKLKKGE